MLLTPQQAEDGRRLASNEIRRREGLLLSHEIRALRKDQLGLTQPEFEKLLGIGPKTVARWEAGTVFQSKAADNLMRALAAVPDVAPFLAERSGVEIPRRSRASVVLLSRSRSRNPRK